MSPSLPRARTPSELPSALEPPETAVGDRALPVRSRPAKAWVGEAGRMAERAACPSGCHRPAFLPRQCWAKSARTGPGSRVSRHQCHFRFSRSTATGFWAASLPRSLRRSKRSSGCASPIIFDLIAGTSTGGTIALGLGLRSSDIPAPLHRPGAMHPHTPCATDSRW